MARRSAGPGEPVVGHQLLSARVPLRPEPLPGRGRARPRRRGRLHADAGPGAPARAGRGRGRDRAGAVRGPGSAGGRPAAAARLPLPDQGVLHVPSRRVAPRRARPRCARCRRRALLAPAGPRHLVGGSRPRGATRPALRGAVVHELVPGRLHPAGVHLDRAREGVGPRGGRCGGRRDRGPRGGGDVRARAEGALAGRARRRGRGRDRRRRPPPRRRRTQSPGGAVLPAPLGRAGRGPAPAARGPRLHLRAPGEPSLLAGAPRPRGRARALDLRRAHRDAHPGDQRAPGRAHRLQRGLHLPGRAGAGAARG